MSGATSLSRVLGSIPGTGDDTFADLSQLSEGLATYMPFHYTGATTSSDSVLFGTETPLGVTSFRDNCTSVQSVLVFP